MRFFSQDNSGGDALRASAAHRSRAIAGPVVALLGASGVGYMSWIGYLGRPELILNIILLTSLALSPVAARNERVAGLHAAWVISIAMILFIYSSLAGVGVMNSGLPVLIMIQGAAGIYLGLRGLRIASAVLTVYTVALVIKALYFPSAVEMAVPAGQLYGRVFQFSLAFLAVHWILARNVREQARLVEQLQLSSAHKSEFLANMSHEIRTPLNGILGMAQAIKERPLDAGTRDMVETVLDSGQTLNTILNDVLDLSKIEAGKLTISPVEADLRETLERMVRLWRPGIEEKGLSLKVELDTGIPRQLVFDPVRVRQCVTNLLSNALKFTETGQITLTAGFEARAEGGLVRIDVRDTGIGMSDEVQSRLFTPFEQGEKDRTRRFGGTGLGLSISRTLATLMQGGLEVRSAPGEGSCFSLTFVAARGEEAVAEPQAIAAVSPDVPSLSGKRVLLVDDVATNRLVARHLLALDGIEVTEAVNGEDALAQLANDPFDAILMDLHMPVMDGIEATRRIRESGISTPVIAMTADVVAMDGNKLAAMQMDALVAKPVERGALSETLSAMLAKSRKRAKLQAAG